MSAEPHETVAFKKQNPLLNGKLPPLYGRFVPLKEDIDVEALYVNNQEQYYYLIKQRKDNDNKNTIKLNKKAGTT